MSNYKPTRRERGEQAAKQARNAPANPVPSAADSNATRSLQVARLIMSHSFSDKENRTPPASVDRVAIGLIVFSPRFVDWFQLRGVRVSQPSAHAFPASTGFFPGNMIDADAGFRQTVFQVGQILIGKPETTDPQALDVLQRLDGFEMLVADRYRIDED